MTNKTNSKQTNSDEQPKTEKPKASLASRARSNLGTTFKETSLVVSIIFGGLVGLYALSVVASSDCGASVNFKSSPSSLLNFQLKKEACKIPVDKMAK
ncbi:MAG: hypothetical protein HWQ23_09095 [Nostoc sp. JL33]|nr:hypothetical protein [Nostoc sp. JL33]MBN3870428.1 hypothetical protein [Nostoc sp. JL33]